MSSLTEQLHQSQAFDERHKWLLDADLTYCSGRFLLLSDDFFFRPSGGYLLHQASEKYLKALSRVVLPQTEIRRSHDLAILLADLKCKIETLSFKKITNSIKNIEALKPFRYVDQLATRDIQTMQKGWKAVDYLVASVRENIDESESFIAANGLMRYIKGSNNKDLNLLIYSLLKNNSSAKYWIDHLLGINTKIDRKLKKYQAV